MFKFESDEPASAPVEIGERRFVIFEPSSAAAARYRNWMQAARTKPDGKLMSALEWAQQKRYEGLNESDAVLVAGCLRERRDDGQDKFHLHPVELEWVQRLPDRIVKPLYDWAARFLEDAEQNSKNGQIGGESSSSSPTS